jgi:hypothetical protein
MEQRSDAGQVQRSFEAVAWRDIAPRAATVFVFPAWTGDELVKVNDVDTARRYYGMGIEMWNRIRNAFALETGGQIEDSGIRVQLQPPHHTHVEVAIPINAPPPFAAPDEQALLQTIQVRTIRIARPA